MAEQKAHQPSQLLAVWPGMGHVALTAGFYLMSKLHMHEEAPLDTEDLFDLDHVDVQSGLARAGHVPISHLYAINDARRGSDLGLVIGEAQPPLHKLEYCRRILDGASRLGVGQVVTFAALASDLHPRDPSTVYGVATDAEGIDALARHKIEALETGQINGMNGVFLAAAAQRGIPAICLLGTMPAFAARIPYPKASHAVLRAFASICGMEVDLEELQEYGRGIEEQLTKGLEKIQEVLQTEPEAEEEKEETAPEAAPPTGPSEEDLRRIEGLFEQAAKDRSKSFELKRELDRLDVFRKYENRFLDLFRKRRPG
jgi:predicted ATP-grasp superfamily ATP-dependent carboligase